MILICSGVYHKALQQMPSQIDQWNWVFPKGETQAPQVTQEDKCSCFSTKFQNYNNSFHAIKQDKGEAWSEHFSAAHG